MTVSSTLSGADAAFVDAAQVARLATSMPDGTPHVVPVCPALDLDRILIASAFDRKVANIRDNPAVCIAFDDYSATLLNEKFPMYPASDFPIVEDTTVIIEIRATRVSSSGL